MNWNIGRGFAYQTFLRAKVSSKTRTCTWARKKRRFHLCRSMLSFIRHHYNSPVALWRIDRCKWQCRFRFKHWCVLLLLERGKGWPGGMMCVKIICDALRAWHRAQSGSSIFCTCAGQAMRQTIHWEVTTRTADPQRVLECSMSQQMKRWNATPLWKPVEKLYDICRNLHLGVFFYSQVSNLIGKSDLHLFCFHSAISPAYCPL